MKCDYCKKIVTGQYIEPCYGFYKTLHCQCSDILHKKLWFRITQKLHYWYDISVCYFIYVYYMSKKEKVNHGKPSINR